MKIYFVRHGQTEANANKIIMGQRMDQSLNQEGIEQVIKLSQELDKTFNKIFCSPLIRACETAEIIAEKIGTPIDIRPALSERDVGELSGHNWDELKRLTEQSGKIFNKYDQDLSNYHGENLDRMEERLLSFIDEVRSVHADKKVLAVSHGGIINIMYNLFNSPDPKPIENASLHVFDI